MFEKFVPRWTAKHAVVGLAFLLSGGAALAYQVVWQRVLSQEIGVDTISTAFVVSIFMIGLGFGALAGGALTKRVGAKLWLAYAILELLIGVFGFASIPILRSVNGWWATMGSHSVFMDFALNCAVLVGPVFLMGMTSPIIMELTKGRIEDWGRVIGVFYGINVLGAAAGSLLAGLLFIEVLGLTGTTLLAGALNLLIAGAFYVKRASFEETVALQGESEGASAAGAAEEDPVARAGAEPSAPVGRLRALRWAGACLLFGFATLSFQMVYFRILLNYMTLSAIVFPLILTAFLLHMSAGQLAAGWLVDRIEVENWHKVLLGLFGAGALATLLSLQTPPAWFARLGLLVFSPSVESMVRDFGSPSYAVSPLGGLILAGYLMLPVFFFSGFFPSVARMATPSIDDAGATFGKVLFWFTIGNVFGAFVTPIWIFERLGTIGATGVSLGALFLAIHLALPAMQSPKPLAASVVICALGCALLPSDYYKRFSYGNYQFTEIIEGQTGVLSVAPTEDFYTLLDMFRTESASAIQRMPEGRSYELYRWNLSEMMALDPNFRPRRCLVIGIGHGYLPRALIDYDFVEEIVVVELSQEVLDGVEKHSHPEVKLIYGHPKVKMLKVDGRRYVQKALARGEHFDLIQNRINEPWRAGGSSLFTVEFLQSCSDLLAPGGYFCTRQMVGYAVSGLEVFRQAIWPGYYHIFFTQTPIEIPKRIELPRALAPFFCDDLPGVAEPFDPLPPERRSMKVLAFSPGDLKGYDLNTDDRPTLEYRYIEDHLERYSNPKVFLDRLEFPELTHEVEITVAPK